MPSPRILYLVHDLSDPSVERRVTMLKDGGATVVLAGFRRDKAPVEQVAGCAAVNMGRTHNGRFMQRMLSVVRELALIHEYRDLFAGADVILARNMEMLAIAVRGKSAMRSHAAIAYESLDIHRLLLGDGPISRSLRRLEGWLASKASALITSSPAFVREYFTPLSSVDLPIMLVENKVYAPDLMPLSENAPSRPAGPPWKIGWFGAIRCRKSLKLLSDLAKANPGKIEVIIRGRPALDQFDDFHKTVAETPGMHFLGPYKNPDDLETIYREVHFTWAIDMFEEGLNSSWLLPNRIYEGGLYRCVPLAQIGVETGRFLRQLGIGVAVSSPEEVFLNAFFRILTTDQYDFLERDAAQVPEIMWRHSREDCMELVEYLAALQDQWTHSIQPISKPIRQDDIATAL